MRRPSYWNAIRWIAQNDSTDDNLTAREYSALMTAALVSDLFGVAPSQVGQDIVRAQGESAQVRAGRKGGQATGARKARTTEQARLAIRARWGPGIRIHYAEGQAPRTDNVQMQDADSQIQARSPLADEARALKEFATLTYIPTTLLNGTYTLRRHYKHENIVSYKLASVP